MNTRKRAGLFGALVGVAAAGVAAGVAAERYVIGRRRNQVEDPYADEPFGHLPSDRRLTVTTDDDVELYVEIVEPEGGEPAELTVVFVHGFCLDLGAFHFQRRALEGKVRMVLYDQPGHGKSGRLSAGDYDLEALGRGLYQVIEQAVPDGPVVLVGHSMGGMTIMSLADQHPELFAERVIGVALISSSAGRLDGVTFGLPEMVARLRRPLMPILTGTRKLTPAMIDRARRASSDLAWLLTRKYGFGGPRPSPSLVSYVEKMNSTTSWEVIAGYLHTLFDHVRHHALEALQGVEVLVMCGEKDLLLPLAHSEEICRLLPNAELAVIPDGGHVVLLECADEVNEHLLAFLDRAARAVHGRAR